jgi:hypothetical protein
MIFVNIACYRDAECQATVQDLFNKARYTEEIIACVVMQTEPADNILFYGKKCSYAGGEGVRQPGRVLGASDGLKKSVGWRGLCSADRLPNAVC